jgi:hypothetical protein
MGWYVEAGRHVVAGGEIQEARDSGCEYLWGLSIDSWGLCVPSSSVGFDRAGLFAGLISRSVIWHPRL